MKHAQILQLIAGEIGARKEQVEAALRLFDDGNTVPFIARYRKEQTGGLDEDALRRIQDRSAYLRALDARKDDVLKSIQEQGKLTPELVAAIDAATALQQVEDIYQPYRPKRRTRASIAREAGLEPLAEWLLGRPQAPNPEAHAAAYLSPEKGISDPDAALAGAMDIIAERVADDPQNRHWVRRLTTEKGILFAKGPADPSIERTPYEQYYEYREPVGRIPPHRVLAINRGEREEVLRVSIEAPVEEIEAHLRRRLVPAGSSSVADTYLLRAVSDTYKRLLAPAIERDVRNALTEKADAQAIRIFSANLRALLLTPPVRGKVVLGVDPGYRTGCKIAVVDATGRLLETTVIYPTPPQNRVEEAKEKMLSWIRQHHVEIVAIGNGTASRETEAFVVEVIRNAPRPVSYIMVSEAGASVYSASPLAKDEFPNLDVSERSAVSIARRLQDPLAELVKIEPKAIGVGQYQHDVSEKALSQSLAGVVESAVNTVGVDLNTASASLLQYVAGLSSVATKNIVRHRDEHGAFASRLELLRVPRMGPKTFEQCAGFLRVPESNNPLDQTPIHPESYEVASRLIQALGFTLADVVGPRRESLRTALSDLAVSEWAHRLGTGVPTLTDIVQALLKPGRDPRDELPPPILRTDVLKMEDLQEGMTLLGTVRNVVDFGAFVDIGVKEDGLVHISELSDRYVKHPLEAVSVGDVVRVQVLSIDVPRSRISLSMKRALQGQNAGG